MAAAVGYFRPKSTQLVKDDLPDPSAIEQLLTRQLFSDHKAHASESRMSGPKNAAAAGESGQRRPTRPDSADADSNLEQHIAQIDKHRHTVQEMSNKVMDLHNKMAELERQNADLRHQLDSELYSTTQPNFTGEDVDKMDHRELARRYDIVKGKLQRQSAELKEYKQKVLELQQKLIEKNDQEKEYLKQQKSFQSQNELVQQLQAKTDQAKKLEDLHRRQEQVIRKLEKLINAKHKDESYDQRANDMLRQESELLASQLDSLMTQQRQAIITPRDRRNTERRPHDKVQVPLNVSSNSPLPRIPPLRAPVSSTSPLPPTPAAAADKPKDARTADAENKLLELRLKHAAAEQRIRSLEEQLEEKAKQWTREKVDLQIKLRETELGLQRPSPITRHRSLTPLPRLAPTNDDSRRNSQEVNHQRSRQAFTRSNWDD